jgi:hypothetical protein
MTSNYSDREVMSSYLSKTITALCGDLAAKQDHCAVGCPATAYVDVTGFVFEQLRKMPPFLRQPIMLATILFGVSRLLIEGSVYHKRPPERRHWQVESWRRSKFAPNRDLMKFYTSLVVLVLYSRPRTQAQNQVGNV